MNYKVLDRTINDMTISVVVEFFVVNENNEKVFIRTENMDFKIEATIDDIRSAIIKRATEVQKIYELHEQLGDIEGNV